MQGERHHRAFPLVGGKGFSKVSTGRNYGWSIPKADGVVVLICQWSPEDTDVVLDSLFGTWRE